MKVSNACSAVSTDYNRLLSEHTVSWVAACMLMPFHAAFVSDPPVLDLNVIHSSCVLSMISEV